MRTDRAAKVIISACGALYVCSALVLAVAASCSGCNHPLPPVDPPSPVTGTCQSACLNAAEHGFSYALPTPNGTDCATVCENAQRFGDTWDLHCMSIAQTQDEADGCFAQSGQSKP